MSKLHLLAAAGVIATGVLAQAPAQADSLSDFYRGKNITFLVGSDPGGSFGPYAQVLAEHMPKYIPERPKIIIKYTGGELGGLGLANSVRGNMQADGATMAMTPADDSAQPAAAAAICEIRCARMVVARQHGAGAQHALDLAHGESQDHRGSQDHRSHHRRDRAELADLHRARPDEQVSRHQIQDRHRLQGRRPISTSPCSAARSRGAARPG